MSPYLSKSAVGGFLDQLHAQIKQMFKQGQHAEARRLLALSLQENPGDAQGWALMVQLVESPQQKIECLRRVLAIEGSSSLGQQAARQLREMGEPSPLDRAEVLRDPAPVTTENLPPSSPGARGRSWLVPGLIGLLTGIGTMSLGILACGWLMGNQPEVAAMLPFAPTLSFAPTSTVTAALTPASTNAATPTPASTPLPTAGPSSNTAHIYNGFHVIDEDQFQVLSITDVPEKYRVGSAVAASEDTVVVNLYVPLSEEPPFIFGYAADDSGHWERSWTLYESPFYLLASSLAIDGDTMVAGTGETVSVFEMVDEEWKAVADFTRYDPSVDHNSSSSRLGEDVELDGDWIISGDSTARFDTPDLRRAPAIFAFHHTEADGWTLQPFIFAPPIYGSSLHPESVVAHHGFAFDVALDGTTAAAVSYGSPDEAQPDAYMGAVFVYDLAGNTSNPTHIVPVLSLMDDFQSQTIQGIAVYGNEIAVTANFPGQGTGVLLYSNAGGGYQLDTALSLPEWLSTGGLQWQSVEMNDRYLVVSIPAEYSASGDYSGNSMIYIYVREPGQGNYGWIPGYVLQLPSNQQPIADKIDLSGDTLVIGGAGIVVNLDALPLP
jgi:hypothetical protein